ncbi:MAG: hypothetical protein NTZ17_13695 [Phycisphaerae bacterium]|nr:hypothetical protein [Phycisphaerae bacterium]
MFKTARHILKADQVAFDGPLHLSLDPAGRPHSTDPQCDSAGPNARVTQNHPQYAIIEVTCACGKTTYIRCDYAAANPAPVAQSAAQA